MHPELRRKALRRAMEIVGARSLRGRLAATDHMLEAWIDGRARIPDRVFDIAVDLILEDDIARAAQDRREQPRESLKPIDMPV